MRHRAGAPSFNGRTADSGSAYRGSNPWGAANHAIPLTFPSNYPSLIQRFASVLPAWARANLTLLCVSVDSPRRRLWSPSQMATALRYIDSDRSYNLRFSCTAPIVIICDCTSRSRLSPDSICADALSRIARAVTWFPVASPGSDRESRGSSSRRARFFWIPLRVAESAAKSPHVVRGEFVQGKTGPRFSALLHLRLIYWTSSPSSTLAFNASVCAPSRSPAASAVLACFRNSRIWSRVFCS